MEKRDVSGVFTGYWVVRKGYMFFGTYDGTLSSRGWYHHYMSAFKYSDKWFALEVAIRQQELHPLDDVYVEYRMSEEDHMVPRIRDYLCYVGCADDGHGGDITRNGLPILSYEEWMKA